MFSSDAPARKRIRIRSTSRPKRAKKRAAAPNPAAPKNSLNRLNFYARTPESETKWNMLRTRGAHVSSTINIPIRSVVRRFRAAKKFPHVLFHRPHTRSSNKTTARGAMHARWAAGAANIWWRRRKEWPENPIIHIRILCVTRRHVAYIFSALVFAAFPLFQPQHIGRRAEDVRARRARIRVR